MKCDDNEKEVDRLAGKKKQYRNQMRDYFVFHGRRYMLPLPFVLPDRDRCGHELAGSNFF